MFDDDPKYSTAIDLDGSILPLKPHEVRRKLETMLETGDIVAVVVVTNGEIGVNVFGPPSEALLEILQQAAKGYKKALRRARGRTN